MRFRFVSDFISVMELKKENAMKSTRRIVAAGLAVATMFGTLGLAGCGSDSGSEQESNPKTIKIWHYEEDNGAQGKAWAKAMESSRRRPESRSSLRRNPSSKFVRTLLRF